MAAIAFTVNGAARTVEVADPDEPLLYVLRNSLGLTGVKFGCGLGQCGSCTVLLDGKAVRSCRIAVSAVAGRAVTTIEGLGTANAPHPVQAAFIAEQAGQCGYCTTGLVMASVDLLARNPHPEADEIRHQLAGNLCRCGSHHRVVRAVLRASGRPRP